MIKMLRFNTNYLAGSVNTPLVLFGSNNIEKTSNIDSTEAMLVNLSGWDEIDNIEIMTEPKLNGRGSYFVGSKINEKEVTFEINLKSNFNQIYQSFKTATLTNGQAGIFNCYITVIDISEAGTPVKYNTMGYTNRGIIKKIEAIDVNTKQDRGNIKITVLFPDPTIEVTTS